MPIKRIKKHLAKKAKTKAKKVLKTKLKKVAKKGAKYGAVAVGGAVVGYSGAKSMKKKNRTAVKKQAVDHFTKHPKGKKKAKKYGIRV